MRVSAKLHQSIQALGLMLELNRVAQSRSFDEAKQQLADLKSKAKQNFKELSLKHHPDVGGDEETMKLLSAAYDEIKKVDIKQAQPRPVAQVVRVYCGGVYSTTSTWPTGSTTSTSGW